MVVPGIPSWWSRSAPGTGGHRLALRIRRRAGGPGSLDDPGRGRPVRALVHPERRLLRRGAERSARCCSCSATTSAQRRLPGCARRTRSTRTEGVAASPELRERQLKVNDSDGNPIDIAAVVVWRVVETAEAMFEVDDYENYVRVQSEAALRNAATSYPYDSHEDHVMSLRGINRRGRRTPEDRSPAAAGQGGRRSARGENQPSGVCTGNRGGDAAASAGRRHHRSASAHRRGSRRHGGDGACRCSRTRGL